MSLFIFTLRRLLFSIPLFFLVCLFSFVALSLAPGDYFDSLITNPTLSQETVDRYKALYHLDQPFYVQFWHWGIGILQGDFGYSFSKHAPVLSIILDYAGSTLILTFSAFLLTWAFGIALGVLSAFSHNSWLDKSIVTFSLLGLSLPVFVLAIVLLSVASLIPGLPISGMTSVDFALLSWYEKILDIGKHLFIPLLILVITGTGGLTRLIRSNLLEILKKPYILNARSRGISERVLHRHVFHAILNPLITLLGYEFSALLSGAAIIEIICSWPGLGSLMFDALLTQDLFLVMGGIMVGSLMLILGNLIADILLFWHDPRIRPL